MKSLWVNVSRRPRDLWRSYGLPWYQHLQQREQHLVMLAAVIIPLLVFVFGLWLPLRDEAQSIRSAMPGLQAQLAEAQLLAGRVAKGGASAADQDDLLTVVDAVARSSHIRRFITRIKPQPGVRGQRVLLQLRKAPYANVVRFLAQMASSGVSTERARLNDVDGKGLVDADIRLRSGKG